MKNIIWQKPDGGFAVTSLADPAADSAAHAVQLKAAGAIPADWVVHAVDMVQPPRSVPEVKAAKLAQLEAARKAAIANLPPVTVAGKAYPANTEYREVITGIARRKAAGRPIPATLRGLDGTPATLNAALIDQIDDAITVAVQAQWDRYWQRVDAVQAATTVEQVNAVEW